MGSQGVVVEVTRVSTTDLDSALEPLEAFFPGFRMRPDRGSPARMELAAYAIPGMSMLSYSLTGGEIEVSTESLGFGAADVQLRGAVTAGRDPVSTHLPFALSRAATAVFTEARGLTVQLDDDVVRRFADLEAPAGSGLLRTLAPTPTSAAAGRSWSTAAGFVRDQLAAGVEDSSPLIAAGLADLLVSAYLATFPTRWSETPRREGTTLRTAALRRAMAYIEDNAHEPITVADIAGEARMSVRGLQAAFRRATGRTPMQVVRATRLQRVRADLVAADATRGDTVEAIARRWGFHHLGRFAAEYRGEFGELPRHTLRR